MHCIMILSCCHRNNQSSTYELFLIQIGGTKVQPCQVWTLSGLRFLTGSWLIEKVSHFAPGYASNYKILTLTVLYSYKFIFLEHCKSRTKGKMTFLCKEDSTKIFNLGCDDKTISSLSILKDLLLIVFSIFLYWIYLGRKTYTEIETMMKMLIIFNLICLCCENYAAYITDESMCNGQKSFMLAMVIIYYNVTLLSVVMNKLRGRLTFLILTTSLEEPTLETSKQFTLLSVFLFYQR